MIHAGKECVVKVSGAKVAATGLVTSTADNKRYQIGDAAKQVIALDSVVVVKDGGTTTTEKYTLNRLEGSIEFDTVDADRIITIDASYLPMSAAASAHVATFGRGCKLSELPKFGVEYMNRLAGQKFAYGTLSQWDIEDSYFTDALLAGDVVVIEVLSGSGEKPHRMFALLESAELQAALDSPQDEAVSFVSTDKYLV